MQGCSAVRTARTPLLGKGLGITDQNNSKTLEVISTKVIHLGFARRVHKGERKAKVGTFDVENAHQIICYKLWTSFDEIRIVAAY